MSTDSVPSTDAAPLEGACRSRRFRSVRRSAQLAGAVLAIGLVAAACGSSSTKSSTATSPSTTSPSTSASSSSSTASSSSSTAKSSSAMAATTVTIDEHTVSGLGAVLTDSAGHTLYMFAPDAQKSVTCTSSACLKAWPPVYGKPVAGAGVKSSLLGTITSGGKTIATYNHWPLYTFIGDTAAGTAKGQAVSGFGGPWYVLNPSGAVVKSSAGKKKAPSASSGGGTAY